MIYAGIDLGGTSIKGALVDSNGKILAQKSIPTGGERKNRYVVEDMAQLVLDLLESEHLTQDDIKSVGIGSPGSIDEEKGEVVFAGNFADFKHVPMVSIMKERIKVPVYLNNDANVAALGESMFGAGHGSKNAVLITLGTGLGGGVIIDGKIFSGYYYGGAELGHQVIVAHGVQCTCGRHGCWEAYSSATGLIRMARTRAFLHPESLLNRMEDNLANLNAKDVFDAADAGDVFAQDACEEYYDYLAIGIGNTINVFQPEYVIIGGGPSARREKLIEPLKKRLINEVFGHTMNTELVIASLGNSAGVIGAAMLGVMNGQV